MVTTHSSVSARSDAARRHPEDDPVTAYAEAVTAGRIVAGRAVRLACARHVRDLTEGRARGLRFDTSLSEHAITFYAGFLCLAEGEHAGQPFELQAWQQFIVGSLFGWLGSDGYRRFRTAYIEAGKGNGKTPLVAGMGLYGLVADEEPGAQIFAAAVSRDQAKILFEDARRMGWASPALARRLEILEHNIAFPAEGSFFRPVSSEARTLDAKRVHMALIDEVHEHPSSLVVDKLRAGTKGRRQALVVEITNSGYNRQSVCYHHHDYSLKVLEGVLANDAWFAYVCQLDPCEACRAAGKDQPTELCRACDDWRDEHVWPKANPNLDVSITRKYLREQVEEAVGMPSKQNIVRRLNFCAWTESVSRWLDMERWDLGGGPPVTLDRLLDRPCYAGLDLSTTTDLTTLQLVSWDGEDGYDVVSFFWCPEETIHERSRKDRVPYDQWVSQGVIIPTPGNVVDYRAIRETMRELSQKVHVAEVAFDAWSGRASRRSRPRRRSSRNSSRPASYATAATRCCAGVRPTRWWSRTRPGTSSPPSGRAPNASTGWWPW
jgi:phage terminase large subunit-like protein